MIPEQMQESARTMQSGSVVHRLRLQKNYLKYGYAVFGIALMPYDPNVVCKRLK